MKSKKEKWFMHKSCKNNAVAKVLQGVARWSKSEPNLKSICRKGIISRDQNIRVIEFSPPSLIS